MHRSDMPEKAIYWRDTRLFDLELLHARYITHAFAPHRHDGYAIGMIEHGAEQFHYRGSTHVAEAGRVVVINPDEVHTGESASAHGWIYRMFYPSVELLQWAAADLHGPYRAVPFFRAPVLHDPELVQHIRMLHRVFAEPATQLERESRLRWTLAHLVLRHADHHPTTHAAGAEPTSIQRVRQFLEQHYAENITLEHLATVANLSPFHLLRVFRNSVGMSPHVYLTDIRIRQARALLKQHVPIADVAAQTGFVDQSHLHRHFKRIVGVTPGNYRKNIQDATQP
ncbi:MAG: AraC family transcriptional regulator [Chloroflexaceae bacterium]|nr:AraC family transcriptional regulator [Chloroflexaceae bacterium]NJO07305.1 AraC family transcriptional regulator [Chloroflexaceae bacterium]